MQYQLITTEKSLQKLIHQNTTCLVGLGTALDGTSVIAKGQFGPNSGMEKSFQLPVNCGMTNQDLVCYISGAGTIDVNVTYFISA